MQYDSSVDTIISMLLNKWYARCGYDWIHKNDFDFIEANIEEILKNFNKMSLDWKDTQPPTINLRRIYIMLNTSEEEPKMEMRYNHVTHDYEPEWEKMQFQKYDILVNTEIISVDSVKKMFEINED